MSERMRDTGNHNKPVRANHAIAEFMWEDGEAFKLVPRSYDGIRTAELHAMDENGQEVQLMLTASTLRILRREIDRLCDWVELES